MQTNSSTGLTCDQENEIITRYEKRYGTEFSDPNNRKVLSLSDSVLLVLRYLRTNLSQHALGEFINVSQSTVSRTISRMLVRIKKLLDHETRQRHQRIQEEQICLVDGTLIPTWNWRCKQGIYSGKHKRKGFNLQTACDTDGTYLCAGKPLAGSTHDTKAFTNSGLENKLTGKSIYADLGYYGTDTAKTPIKKPQFRELSNIEKQINKEHAQLRSPVERCIAHIKNWKILSTVYRGPLYKLKSFIETVLALETFRTSH